MSTGASDTGATFEARRGRFRFDAKGRTAWRLEDVARGEALDVSALAARLLFASPIVPGATPYLGVRATFERSTPPLRLDARPPPRAPEEAAAQLREGLTRAVAHALEGARRVAVLTGGGLDSSVLLALAHKWAEEHGASVFAASLDFEGPGDDRPHLAALARRLSCEVVRARPEDAAHRIDLLYRGVDAAPFTWPSGLMEIETLARARANGAEVILTGVGADELLDGEPRALSTLVRRDPLAAVRSARRLRGFDRPSRPLVDWLVRPLISRRLPATVHRWRARQQKVAPPPWAGPAVVDYLHAASRSAEGGSIWERPHHEHLAWLRHQEDVAAKIACLQPYLEPAVRSLVGAFEPAWLLHGDVRRGLLREAFRDLLPRSLAEREDKATFENALRDLLLAAGGIDALRPLASVTELASHGLVAPARFAEAFAAFERAPMDNDHWLTCWPVLAVEAFLRGRARGGAP